MAGSEEPTIVIAHEGGGRFVEFLAGVSPSSRPVPEHPSTG